MTIHINIFTNVCGISTTFLLANSVMDNLVPSVALYVNLIVNSTRLPTSTFSSLWLVDKIGRRPLFLWSAFLLGACNFGIGFGYLGNSQVTILVLILIFTIVFGLFYNPVMIIYPAEIIPPQQYIIANIVSQISMMVSFFVPPLVMGAAGGNGFGLFMFYGVYSALSFVYKFFYLKESKGLKYEQIIKSY